MVYDSRQLVFTDSVCNAGGPADRLEVNEQGGIGSITCSSRLLKSKVEKQLQNGEESTLYLEVSHTEM